MVTGKFIFAASDLRDAIFKQFISQAPGAIEFSMFSSVMPQKIKYRGVLSICHSRAGGNPGVLEQGFRPHLHGGSLFSGVTFSNLIAGHNTKRCA